MIWTNEKIGEWTSHHDKMVWLGGDTQESVIRTTFVIDGLRQMRDEYEARIAELEAQLAEAQAEVEKWKDICGDKDESLDHQVAFMHQLSNELEAAKAGTWQPVEDGLMTADNGDWLRVDGCELSIGNADHKFTVRLNPVTCVCQLRPAPAEPEPSRAARKEGEVSEPFWKQHVPQDELEAQWDAIQDRSDGVDFGKDAFALARFAEARMYERARKVVEELQAKLDARQWSDAEAREALAAYAHEAWSGWMAYMFSKGSAGVGGTWIMPSWAVSRWHRQMTTPYAELSDGEKDSDRAEADKILAIVQKHGHPWPQGDEAAQQLARELAEEFGAHVTAHIAAAVLARLNADTTTKESEQ